MTGTNNGVQIRGNVGSFNSGGIQLDSELLTTNPYTFNDITIENNTFGQTNFINAYDTAPTNGLSGLIPAVMATATEGGASGRNLIIRNNQISLDLGEVKYATDHKSSFEVRGRFNGVTVTGNTVTPTGTNDSSAVTLLTGLSLNGSLPGQVSVNGNQFLGVDGNPNGDSYYGIDFIPTLDGYGTFSGELSIDGNTINDWQVGVILRLEGENPNIGNRITVGNNTFSNNELNVFDQVPPVIITGSVVYTEGQAANAVLGTIRSNDSLPVQYEIVSGNDDGFFLINTGTGAITLAPNAVASPANDFNSGANTFTLGIRATDAGGEFAERNVTLEVIRNGLNYQKYDFTYYYGGNGDSYSGYVYAEVGAYDEGERLGFFDNETGDQRGFYIIDAIDPTIFSNSDLDGQVFVTSYNDADTGYGETTNLTPVDIPNGVEGLESELGFAYRRDEDESVQPLFSNFQEADLISENVKFEYTYYYNSADATAEQPLGDYYVGTGIANRVYLEQFASLTPLEQAAFLNLGPNDTFSTGVYVITSVDTVSDARNLTENATDIEILEYYDIATDQDGNGTGGYGKADRVTSVTGTSGFGSESGIAFNNSLQESSDSSFTPLDSADIATDKTSLRIQVAGRNAAELRLNEGNGNVTTPFTFEVVRDGDLNSPLQVTWFTEGQGVDNNTRADGLDFVVGSFPTGTVTFNPGESVVPFTVDVLGDNTFEQTENFRVTIVVTPGPDNPVNLDNIVVTRASAIGQIVNDDRLRAANTSGDPHLVTLDGFAYDFMAVGEFVLLETTPGSENPFQIQVRYEPFPGSDVVSIATRMAVRLGEQRVELRLGNNPLLIDGGAVPIADGGSLDLNGDSVPDIQRNGSQYIITLNTLGEQVRVNLFDAFMDVNVSVAESPEGSTRNFRGLLGNLNNDRTDDLTDRNGIQYARQPIDFAQLYGPFADSWRLDAVGTGDGKDSLFSYSPNQGVGSFDNANFPQGVIDITQFPADLVAAAEAAAAGIADPVLRQSAVYDFLLSGDQDFIDSAANTPEPEEEGDFGSDTPVITSIGVSATPTSIVEGNEGSQPVTFTFFRTEGTGTLTVDYQLDGTIDAADLAPNTPFSGSVNFADGVTEVQVVVEVLGDLDIEPDERLAAVIVPNDNLGSAVIASQRARTIIVNDDFPPLTINPIAGNDVVNRAERTAGIAITGATTATGAIAQVRVTIGSQSKTGAVDASGNWSINFSQQELPQSGGFVVEAIGITQDGLETPPATRELLIDSIAPGIPVINPVAGDNVIDPSEQVSGVQITGTAERNSTVQLTFGNVTRTLTAINGAWSASIDSDDLPSSGALNLVVSATDAVGNTSALASRVVNIITPSPAIAIDKVTNGADGRNIFVGQPIVWTYTVTNLGNVAISNVVVTDDQGEVPVYVSGDLNNDGILQTTETWVYEANGVATLGAYTNLGTVNGDFNGTPVTAQDASNYTGSDAPAPVIAINKVTNGADGRNIFVGAPIVWTYTITNPGNVDISNVVVTDDQGEVPVLVSGDLNNDDILQTTETWVYETNGVATLGAYENLGTVNGDFNGTPVTAQDASNYFGSDAPAPDIAINKVTNGADGRNIIVGAPIVWTYTVTNPGNVDISNVVVIDDQDEVPVLVSGDLNNDGILQTTETWVYEANDVATTGAYTNLGTVTGDFNGTPVTAQDVSSYFGAFPAIAINKVTNGADALSIPVNAPIVWTYTVTNPGNVDISNVVVTDNQGVIPVLVSGDTDEDGILDTTETWVYEANGVAILGAYENLGTVTGDFNGTLVTANDASTYFGQSSLIITPEPDGNFVVTEPDGTETVLTLGGEPFTQTDAEPWEVLGVAVVDGVNQVLWIDPDTQQIGIWNTNANWNYVSAEISPEASLATLNAEVDFQVDINGDGIIGDDAITIEENSSVTLFEGVFDFLHVETASGLQTAITYENLGFANNTNNWQALAAEVVGGINQVLWRNETTQQIGIWDTNASWNYESAEVSPLASYNTLQAEVDFQVDINGDGILGDVPTPIEENGSVALWQGIYDTLYAQELDPLTNPVPLKVGGQVFENDFAVWQPLAADVIGGSNQVLWEELATDALSFWNADSAWNWISSSDLVAAGTPEYQELLNAFGVDASALG